MTDEEAYKHLAQHRPVIIRKIELTRSKYGSSDHYNIAKKVINHDDPPDLKDMIRKAVKYMYDNEVKV